MEGDDHSTQFNELLVKIAQKIGDIDFKNLKFLYYGCFPKQQVNKMQPIDLLHELESKKIISIQNIDELKRMVEICMDGNRILLRFIDEFKQSVQSPSNTTSTSPGKNEDLAFVINKFESLPLTFSLTGSEYKFKVLLLKLTEYLKEEDLKMMKMLYSENIALARMQHIKHSIDLFQELYYLEIITENKIDVFEKSVDQCTNGNPRLLQMIRQYKTEEVKTNTTEENFAQSSQNITPPPILINPENSNVDKNVSLPSSTGDLQEKYTTEIIGEHSYQSSSASTPAQNLHIEVELLINNLKNSWIVFFQKLSVSTEELETRQEQNPTNNKHVIKICLDDWLSKMPDKTYEEIREEWIKALKESGRNDLANELTGIEK